MRSASLYIVICASCVLAQDKPKEPPLDAVLAKAKRIAEEIKSIKKDRQPHQFDEGDVVKLKSTRVRILRILGPEEFEGYWGTYKLLVKGVPTKGLVDDDAVPLDGLTFKVGIKKELGSTYFSIGLWSPANRLTLAEQNVFDRWVKDQDLKKAALEKERMAADAAAKSKAEAKRRQDAAAAKLKLIQVLITDGKTDTARFRLEQLIKDYHGTKGAAEAAKVLESLK